MLYDRRKTRRTRVQLQASWEGDGGLSDGLVSDISTGGCFILTSGQAKDRELVRVEITLPNDKVINIWGKVIEYMPEIGFSMCFTTSDEIVRSFVETLTEVKRYDRRKSPKLNKHPEIIIAKF